MAGSLAYTGENAKDNESPTTRTPSAGGGGRWEGGEDGRDRNETERRDNEKVCGVMRRKGM